MSPGRLHEVPSDRHPSQMIMAPLAGYRIRLIARSFFLLSLVSSMTCNAAVIIPAAGFGTRMSLERPKQFVLLAGLPVLVRALRPFYQEKCFSRLVVAAPADRLAETRALLDQHGFGDGRVLVVAGGRRRQDSVKAALEALDREVEVVLVHDGARPLVSREVIRRCLAAVARDGAAIVAVPVKDTLKRGDAHVEATIDRHLLWQAQTPQGARRELLERAYRENGDREVTDESSLLERAAIPVTLVPGSEVNLKITRPEDLLVAEKLLSPEVATEMRVGHGYDAHRFADHRPLILGGVHVPHGQGLAGHSDADVLTHALCDAILGALGCGDIGQHFPDSDASYAGISSLILLERVMELAAGRGARVINADLTVVCQAPKLAAFLPRMGEILAAACGIESGRINLKATTTEGMGFAGRKEGIGCHAVVLLQQQIQERL